MKKILVILTVFTMLIGVMPFSLSFADTDPATWIKEEHTALEITGIDYLMSNYRDESYPYYSIVTESGGGRYTLYQSDLMPYVNSNNVLNTHSAQIEAGDPTVYRVQKNNIIWSSPDWIIPAQANYTMVASPVTSQSVSYTLTLYPALVSNFDWYTFEGVYVRDGNVADEYFTDGTNDVLTYFNDTGANVKVRLKSLGMSNVTITEPLRLYTSANIGTTDLNFILTPAETITIIRNSGDDISLLVDKNYSPTAIDQPLEYASFTQPANGLKTNNKYIIVWANYRIKSDSVSEVVVQPRTVYYDPPGSYSYGNDPNVEGVRTLSHKQYDKGDYVEGYIEMEYDLKNAFTGYIEFMLSVDSSYSTQYASTEIEIVPFIDANNDGINDNTGELPPEDINIDDWLIEETISPSAYPDTLWGAIQYQTDRFFELFTMPFKFIENAIKGMADFVDGSLGWINDIAGFIKVFFSFLPEEILSALTFLFIFGVIFSLIKLIRG